MAAIDDDEIQKLMTSVLDEAWAEVASAHQKNDPALHTIMSLVVRILLAVHEGVRSRDDLKRLALTAVRGLY